MFNFRSFVFALVFGVSGCDGCTSASGSDAAADTTVTDATDATDANSLMFDVHHDGTSVDATSTVSDASLDAHD